MQTNCRTVVGRGILSAGQRKYQEKPGTSDSWQGREGWGLEEEKDAKATSRAGHEPASEMRKRIGAGGTWFTEDASFSALRQGGVVPSSGRWGGGRETAAQAAECPPNYFQKLEEQRSGAASWAGLGWAEAELGRRWAWRGRAGRRGLRAALGPAGRPAGSREVDKAAAAFDVSGELILNRYKMAEGDEAARRQQPHQGLRRRRRTSDPSVGVNHVSSTTSLGTGRRGAEAAGAAGEAGEAARRLGLGGAPGARRGRGLSGRLGLRFSRRRRRCHRGRRPRGLSLRRAPRSAARPGRPRLAQLAAERAARPPAHRRCRRRRRVAAAVSTPTQGGGLEPGPRRGAGRDSPRSAAAAVVVVAGSVTPRRALRCLRCPARGRGGREARDALGPAVAVAVAAEDAGTAGTWLPGRRARRTHPMGAAVRKARAVAAPGLLRFPSSWKRPDPFAGVVLGRGSKCCWLRLSNEGGGGGG